MVEERSEEWASGGKSIQGRGSSADNGPVAGAQRVKGELVMWRAESWQSRCWGSVSLCPPPSPAAALGWTPNSLPPD